MILVRDVFRLRYGKAKEARALLAERTQIMASAGLEPSRQLMDLTGPYDTLVIESTHASVAEWESALARAHANPTWAEWFGKFRPLVDSGSREILTVVEPK